MPDNAIEGWILAGGRSTRMGRDKALLELEGETFLGRAASALSPITNGRISMAGAVGLDTCRIRSVPDDANSGATDCSGGPVWGLRTVFGSGTVEWQAVLACDMPLVTPHVFIRLAEARADDIDAVIAVECDSRVQPLCGIYRRSTCGPLLLSAPAQEQSVRSFLKRLRIRYVSFAESESWIFLNVNTPEDYSRARVLISEHAQRSSKRW